MEPLVCKNTNEMRLPSAALVTGATSTFGRTEDGMLPTGKPSMKTVGIPDGHKVRATEQAMLPMPQLREGARKGDILLALAENTLVSIHKSSG